MAVVTNGRVPASSLATIQTGMVAAKHTVIAYVALKAAAKKQLGRTISIAQPAGAYRSFAVQDAMHVAGSPRGTAAQRRRWGLNPNSVVSIASAGYSSHGFGTRIDIVGTAMDAAFLNLAAKYGFVREFGSADPNHFIDKGTYKVTVPAKVKAAVVSKKVYVTVKSGDTLSGIAAHYSTSKSKLSVAKLQSLNPKVVPTQMRIGAKIRIA